MTTTRRRPTARAAALTTAAAVVALTAAGALLAPSATARADEPSQGRLLLMLDASGSMKDDDPSGLTKMEAAKKALTGVVKALARRRPGGAAVYGAKQPGASRPRRRVPTPSSSTPSTTLDQRRP